jgi:hypothetical protein
MSSTRQVPLFRPAAILLGMLSLSIGWGIRGNFGHELGAMLPGVLTGITRYVYHGTAVGGNSPMNNMRFGDKADCYIKPVLKRAPHR